MRRHQAHGFNGATPVSMLNDQRRIKIIFPRPRQPHSLDRLNGVDQNAVQIEKNALAIKNHDFENTKLTVSLRRDPLATPAGTQKK